MYVLYFNLPFRLLTARKCNTIHVFSCWLLLCLNTFTWLLLYWKSFLNLIMFEVSCTNSLFCIFSDSPGNSIMSFLKKLLKRPNKQKDGSTGSSPRSSPGPRKPRGSLTSDLRSSPAASPKHVAQTTTLNVRTPTSKHVAQVLEGLLLGQYLI